MEAKGDTGSKCPIGTPVGLYIDSVKSEAWLCGSTLEALALEVKEYMPPIEVVVAVEQNGSALAAHGRLREQICCGNDFLYFRLVPDLSTRVQRTKWDAILSALKPRAA